MPMQMMREGAALGAGILSGVATQQFRNSAGAKPLYDSNPADPNAIKVWADTAVEVVAAVGGSAMQYFMPFTAPQVVDGLVDGGLALLARRATMHFMKPATAAATQAYMGAAAGNAYPAGAWALPGGMPAAGMYGGNGRAQVGSVGGLRHNRSY